MSTTSVAVGVAGIFIGIALIGISLTMYFSSSPRHWSIGIILLLILGVVLFLGGIGFSIYASHKAEQARNVVGGYSLVTVHTNTPVISPEIIPASPSLKTYPPVVVEPSPYGSVLSNT